jgi:uncharacterized protein
MRRLFLLTCLFLTDLACAAPYSAPFWLPGGHLQTIYAATLANKPQINYRRERWELDDGDFIDADWIDTETSDSNTPVVVLFHGLEGNSQSQYATALMSSVKSKGWRGVVIHFRGCSGEPNRLPRAYYAGDTDEIERLLSRVRASALQAPIYAVGVSLGGNALLKWLGEKSGHANSIINMAIAVSAPMDLAASANALDNGLNRILYTPHFVDTMRPKALAMLKRFPNLLNEKLDETKIKSAKTIHDIDNAVTAVLYGASDAEDYYEKNASKPWLKQITLPTLIINARNDPFIPVESLPTSDDVSSFVTLEYPEEGGHVGFPTQLFSNQAGWLPSRILDFYESNTID